MLARYDAGGIPPKLTSLLRIAAHVEQGRKKFTTADVATARAEGATDLDTHDIVLIAAAFCMYNLYVDRLATVQPDEPTIYRERGKVMARDGYVALYVRTPTRS